MINKLKELYRKSFNDGETYINYFFNHKFDINQTLTIEKYDKLVSMLFLIKKDLIIRGRRLSCPYVVGACTDKEYRNQGLMDTLLKDAFNKLYRDGICITGLYPFRHSYYKKQGFITANRMNTSKIEYNPNKCNQMTADLTFAEKLAVFYNNEMKDCDFYIARDTEYYRNKIAEISASNGKTIVITVNNLIVGYAMYDAFEVAEAIGTGYEAISEINQMNGTCPSDNGDEWAMLRIINAKEILSKLSYPPNINTIININITDNYCSDNNTTLEIKIVEGSAVVNNSDNYDYNLTIEELTLLVTGAYLREGYYPEIKLQEVFAPTRSCILDQY